MSRKPSSFRPDPGLSTLVLLTALTAGLTNPVRMTPVVVKVFLVGRATMRSIVGGDFKPASLANATTRSRIRFETMFVVVIVLRTGAMTAGAEGGSTRQTD